MSHRKWIPTKQQPGRARAGYQISYCLVSLHFLCDILRSSTVRSSRSKVDADSISQRWAWKHDLPEKSHVFTLKNHLNVHQAAILIAEYGESKEGRQPATDRHKRERGEERAWQFRKAIFARRSLKCLMLLSMGLPESGSSVVSFQPE